MPLVEHTRLRELLLQQQHVLGASGAEVREVVQHEAEDLHAVLVVLRRVQDVGVPRRVELLGRYDSPLGIHRTQLQEAAVLEGEAIGCGHRDPGLTGLRVNELVYDGLKIELIDEAELALRFYYSCHDGDTSCRDYPEITG